jgi:hypothetical protein
VPEDSTPQVTLRICDLDGVVDHVSETIEGQAPVYLAWSPHGRHLAVLSQDDESLLLTTYRADALQRRRTLERGSPLFFTWADQRIAAYVGAEDGEQGELLLLDPEGKDGPVRLPPSPRNFCAPLWRRREVIYVADMGGRLTIVRVSSVAGVVRELEHVEGLVALVGSPDGNLLARAMARGGDGTPYTDLAIVDLKTRDIRTISEDPCLAFFWSPTGAHLIVATVDTRRNLLIWWRQELDGTRQRLAAMRPTRELAFYLRFFEQYTQTHPIVDPAGSAIVVGGQLVGDELGDGGPTLWRIPLDGSDPSRVGDGVFAVFPRPSAG